MTINELNRNLDRALRAYIKVRKHILTGALYDSVMYDCAFTSTGLNLKFSSNYYIKFLEYGEFVQDFYNLESTNEIIAEFVSDMITEGL